MGRILSNMTSYPPRAPSSAETAHDRSDWRRGRRHRNRVRQRHALHPGYTPWRGRRAEKLRRQGDGWAARHAGFLRESEARRPPPCKHFGPCGGCVLHIGATRSIARGRRASWKPRCAAAGFADPHMGQIQITPPRSRRRMDLAARRTPRGVVVGLHQRGVDASPVAQDRAAETNPHLRPDRMPRAASCAVRIDCAAARPADPPAIRSARSLHHRQPAGQRHRSSVADRYVAGSSGS